MTNPKFTPPYALLFMEYLEEKVLNNAKKEIERAVKVYIEDIFLNWKIW